jgi:hypothetical protein
VLFAQLHRKKHDNILAHKIGARLASFLPSFLGCKNDDKGRVRLKRLFGAFSF